MSKRGFKTAKNTKTDIDSPLKPAAIAFKPTGSWKLIMPALLLFKKHIVTATFIFVLPGLLAVLAGKLIGGFTVVNAQSIAGVILIVIVCLWLIMNIAAAYYFQLRIIADEAGRPGIIETYRYSARYILRIIALGVFVLLTVGFGLLLIVPGIIALRRYFLAPYFMIDSDLGIREAMQESAKATKPYRGYIWSMLVIMIIFSGIGVGAQRLWPSYGSVISAILIATYIMLPALRYREVALQKSALAIKD